MSLRSEVKETFVEVEEHHGYDETATTIRAENWDKGRGARSSIEAAQAVLTVIDQYEEVEVDECKTSVEEHWYRLPGCNLYGHSSCRIGTRTILRRKQKPDVPELARRAVKTWKHRYNASEPMMDAMRKLADALDE